MNKLQLEWLAFRKSIGIYLRYRKKPIEYYNNWEFVKVDRASLEWENQYRPKLLHFKNKYQGQDCFIIGNGPSINKMDLESLNNYFTFGLNKIYLIFDRVSINLDFLVSVNPLVIEQSVNEFNKLKIPKFISYYGSRGVGNFDEYTYKIKTKGGVESSGNILNTISEGYTVTNVALQIAHFMGFANVFLIGVDHNFKQNGKPNEEQTMTEDDVNHFDPNYFKGLKWHLADLEGSELAYTNTKFLYNRTGRKIYDATLNGKLQVFDKIDYNEALSIAKRKT